MTISAASFVLTAAATSAGAAPAQVDMSLAIGAATEFLGTGPPPLSPSGATVTVARRNFVVLLEVALVTPQPASAKVRFALGEGLRWGADAPDPSETCTSTPSAGECDTPQLQPVLGGSNIGWYWDVVSPGNGTYTYSAEIVSASEPDPQPANNRSSITVVVNETAAGGGSGGGGGSSGGGTVSASAVKLIPARPKAGAAVAATVRVTAGGTAIRPTRVACSGTIGNARLRGVPRTGAGTATCTYRPPRSAKGKTLRGAVSFTARGQRFSKRFSAKLG